MQAVPLAISLLLMMTGGGPAERDVVVVNQSDKIVNEVYVSPGESEQWGQDRLGDATIGPRQQLRIKLGAGSAAMCVYDIQIVYSDASHEERRGQDVCRDRILVFDATGARPAPRLAAEDHRVLIVDAEDMAIQQVLISPAESGDWGENRLAADSLASGGTGSVTYRGGCLADLRVVFENRAAEERRGLDLCALGGVTIAPGWTTAARIASPGPPLAAAGPVSVVVVNHAGRTLRALYIYDSSNKDPGPDRLGDVPLEDGGRIALDVPRPSGACRYAARIVYRGALPDQILPGLDLCHEPTLIVPPPSRG